MKKTKTNKITITKYVLLSFGVLAIALLIGSLTNLILSFSYKKTDSIDHVVGMLEGIIGAIAAGLVLYQLRASEKTERHQNEIEEASFALQYNQAFIQDPNMTAVERLLEDQAYYDTEPREILKPENRQNFINYLVYLESMAPLILSGILALDYIDNLMAYRFFLAVDNAELQTKEILPFAEYYRGCFRLYKVWSAYRKEKGLKCPKEDCTNKDAMRALSSFEDFERYASES